MDESRRADLEWIADNIEKVAQALRGVPDANGLPASDIIRQKIAIELSKIEEIPAEVRTQAGWNMLLYLYEADSFGEKCITKQLCSVSGAPPTTALRHIQSLVEEGLIYRATSEIDQRISLYSIAPKAVELVERWAKRRSEALTRVLTGSSNK